MFFSAINLKEVTVLFNGEVDKTTAEKTSNYSAVGLSFSKAELQADKKTVVLTSNTTLTNNKAYSLTVSNVKNAAGLTVTAEAKAFTAVDDTIPTVKNIEFKSNKVLEVTYSEPLNVAPAAGQIKVDNVAIDTIGGYVASPTTVGSSKYTFTVTTPWAAGEHTVVVNADSSLKDYAGYIVPTVT